MWRIRTTTPSARLRRRAWSPRWPAPPAGWAAPTPAGRPPSSTYRTASPGAPRATFFVAFLFNDTATTEIYTLSLPDALPISGVTGSADGSGAAAQFNAPWGIAADPAGNLYVADTGNDTIRKITAAGVVSTVAGVANQHGIQLGCLPGSLSYPFGVTLADTNFLALTSANSVLNLVVPSPEGLGGVGRADQKTAAAECGDRGDGHQEGPHGPGDIGE